MGAGLRKVAGITVAAPVVSGCYTVKLDPGARSAEVYVNGHRKGEGRVERDVWSKYGIAGLAGFLSSPSAWCSSHKFEDNLPRLVDQPKDAR